MEPAFHDHEYLIIDEITYRFRTPVRGEIVVFRYPQNPQEHFIKRIVGLPGEKVEIKDGQVYIIDKDNPEGYILNESFYIPDNVKTFALKDEIIELRDNEYFVMGDNRNASKDSRIFGAVNKSFLTGRVVFRGWPFNQVTVFHTPEYKN